MGVTGHRSLTSEMLIFGGTPLAASLRARHARRFCPRASYSQLLRLPRFAAAGGSECHRPGRAAATGPPSKGIALQAAFRGNQREVAAYSVFAFFRLTSKKVRGIIPIVISVIGVRIAL